MVMMVKNGFYSSVSWQLNTQDHHDDEEESETENQDLAFNINDSRDRSSLVTSSNNPFSMANSLVVSQEEHKGPLPRTRNGPLQSAASSMRQNSIEDHFFHIFQMRSGVQLPPVDRVQE